VLEVLRAVAPGLDPQTLPPDANLRDALDVDSMDFLHFAIGLHKAFGVAVPEADYESLYTLADCVEYLERKLGAA